MGCGGLPTIHPGSSIPELINFIRHSFRECEFDEVQNTLMEREKGMKIEILNLSRNCDSLKKNIDFMENSQDLEKSRMGKEIEGLRFEKLGLEEKLNIIRRKCEESDDSLVRMGKENEDLRCEKLSLKEMLHNIRIKYVERNGRIVRMGEEIEGLRREKSSLVEKLDISVSKCEERDNRLVGMGKEIEDLRREKLSLEVELDSTRSKCEERDDRLVRMGKEIEDLRSGKLSLEEKLDTSVSKCEERDEQLARMGEEIEGLRREKSSLVEKLDISVSKCEERDNRLVGMGKEIEDLRREKLSLEVELDSTRSKCEERDDRLVRMGKEIEDLRSGKLSLEEKLDTSVSKCEERDEQLARMGKEIEDLRLAKLDADQTIKELKRKEIEATQTIDEFKVRLETALAKMLQVNVEDLSKLINGLDIFAAAHTGSEEEESVNLPNPEMAGRDCLGNDNVNADAEDGVIMSPKGHATSDSSSGSGNVGSSKKGGRNLAHSRTKEAHSRTKEDGAIVICTSGQIYSSAVAETNGIVQDNEGKATEVKGRSDDEVGRVRGNAEVSSSAAGIENVILISDTDDETDSSCGQRNKRNRADDSPINWSAKRKITSTSTTPSSLPRRDEETCTDSDDESYSDTYMDNLVATLQSRGRCRK